LKFYHNQKNARKTKREKKKLTTTWRHVVGPLLVRKTLGLRRVTVYRVARNAGNAASWAVQVGSVTGQHAVRRTEDRRTPPHCIIITHIRITIQCRSQNDVILMGCLHDPTNVQQTFNKCIQNTHANAGRVLEVCRTFAGSCKHPIKHTITKMFFFTNNQTKTFGQRLVANKVFARLDRCLQCARNSNTHPHTRTIAVWRTSDGDVEWTAREVASFVDSSVFDEVTPFTERPVDVHRRSVHRDRLIYASTRSKWSQLLLIYFNLFFWQEQWTAA